MPVTGIPSDVSDIVGLKELWAMTVGDPRICVAVLDGPVDLSHACFAGANVTCVETLISCKANTGPAAQHGTHIASVIFAQHSPLKTSVLTEKRCLLRGVAPRCRGLIVPVFKNAPDGILAPCSQLDLARAIMQAIQGGAHIINISGGELSPSGTAHPFLADAVRNAARQGVLIVSAAGNDGCDCLHVPGALPGVLTVGAMDLNCDPLAFSNWGQIYQTQGILAPGVDILGALPGAGTTTQTGTSYATPIVAGVAGLLLSLQLKLGQKPNPQAVYRILLDTAFGCESPVQADCRRILAGRLNISGAVVLISEGVRSMSEPSEIDDASSPPAEVGEGFTSASACLSSVAPAAFDPTATPVSQTPTLSAAAASLTPTSLASPSTELGQVRASTCSCGCGGGPAQLVFALGQLGYDFGTEARRDSIQQHMKQPANPYDPRQLLAYLDDNPWDAGSINWTLNLDATPIYAIQPHGVYGREIGDRLRQFLREQVTEGVERVSVPGSILGSARLFTGQVVPVIHPALRGMYSWTTRALVQATVGGPPPEAVPQEEKDRYDRRTQGVRNFLTRIYDELRNLGVTSQDRAINYSATNAMLASQVFQDAIQQGIDFDRIEVERSPICRPDSDCWDVKLSFFDPKKVFEQARKVYRFTIDVSDVVPVMVGPVRSWFVR
ncbi:MAG TPA: PatA/PatG family cyanobactin maturation protease [Lacipirellulaceae bacterium]